MTGLLVSMIYDMGLNKSTVGEPVTVMCFKPHDKHAEKMFDTPTAKTRTMEDRRVVLATYLITAQSVHPQKLHMSDLPSGADSTLQDLSDAEED